MIPVEEDFILNLSASCTKEQAVLRLLGWGRNTIYPKQLHLSEDGNLRQDPKLIYRPDFSLQEFLSGIYKEALSTYSDAVPEGATDEEVQDAIESHAPRIEEAEAFIETARSYMLDIVDELSKGADSALRLDNEATALSGVVHITLKSLDTWSESTYPIKADAVVSAQEPDIHALLDTVKDVDGTAKSDFSLYVTLALAVQAFAQKAGGKFLNNGEVNVQQVAGHLEALGAGERANGSNLPSQSEASIRARITKALDRHRIVKGH